MALRDGNGVPVNKRGSGARRLILLSFFRAQAERAAGGKEVIYAIEEPETSQHPDNQRALAEALALAGAAGDGVGFCPRATPSRAAAITGASQNECTLDAHFIAITPLRILPFPRAIPRVPPLRVRCAGFAATVHAS